MLMFTALLACSNPKTDKVESNSTIDSEYFLPSQAMMGNLSSDFKTYTETSTATLLKYKGNSVTVTFNLTVKESGDAFCGRYFENIEYGSFENTNGWDKATFNKIEDIEYNYDKTEAIVKWSYTATQDGEETIQEENSTIVLFQACEYQLLEEAKKAN